MCTSRYEGEQVQGQAGMRASGYADWQVRTSASGYEPGQVQGTHTPPALSHHLMKCMAHVN